MSDMSDMSGPWRVPGYAEVRQLGRGGAGTVVMATDDAGVPVAIKYLSPELLGDEEFREAFRAEADLLKELSTPHVVRLYEFVETDRGAAIVMELVEGASLRATLTEHGATEPESALAVLKGSLLGLQDAHRAGVVHRDYKPENVLITAEGRSLLADFGVAIRSGGDADGTGTPAYMAPEQWAGGIATPRGDIYAATATFVECLTGAPPFTASGLDELRTLHESAALPDDLVPEAVRELAHRGLAKDPHARPEDAGAFLADLDRVAAAGYGEGWEERGRSSLGRRVALLALLLPLAGAAATGAASASTTLGGAPAGSGAVVGGWTAAAVTAAASTDAATDFGRVDAGSPAGTEVAAGTEGTAGNGSATGSGTAASSVLASRGVAGSSGRSGPGAVIGAIRGGARRIGTNRLVAGAGGLVIVGALVGAIVGGQSPERGAPPGEEKFSVPAPEQTAPVPPAELVPQAPAVAPVSPPAATAPVPPAAGAPAVQPRETAPTRDDGALNGRNDRNNNNRNNNTKEYQSQDSNGGGHKRGGHKRGGTTGGGTTTSGTTSGSGSSGTTSGGGSSTSGSGSSGSSTTSGSSGSSTSGSSTSGSGSSGSSSTTSGSGTTSGTSGSSTSGSSTSGSGTTSGGGSSSSGTTSGSGGTSGSSGTTSGGGSGTGGGGGSSSSTGTA